MPLITQEQLNSWYMHESNKERTIRMQEADEDEEEEDEDQIGCEECNYTGEVEITEHVQGDNVMPGGYWEGTGEFRKCHCQIDWDDQEQ